MAPNVYIFILIKKEIFPQDLPEEKNIVELGQIRFWPFSSNNIIKRSLKGAGGIQLNPLIPLNIDSFD